MGKDDLIHAERCEAARHLFAKSWGLLAGHRNEGQLWSRKPCQSVLRRDEDGIRCRADADRRRITGAASAISVRPPGSVQQHGAGAGAASIYCEQHADWFQFGLIGCSEES